MKRHRLGSLGVVLACVALLGAACGDDTDGGGATTAKPSPDGAVVRLLDPQTGEQRWASTMPGGWSTTPLLIGDHVYVQVADDCRDSQDTTLVALDATSGDIVWTAASATGCGFGDILPLVTAEVAVVVDDGQLRGLDPATGERRWSRPDDPEARPVVVDGAVLLAPIADAPGAQRIDPATGEPTWTSSDLRTGDPLGGNGRVVASLRIEQGPTAVVRLIDAVDGSTRWSSELPFHERLTSPVVGEAAVVVSVSNGVGAPIPEGDKPGASLVDTVAAFAPDDGHELWRHEYRPDEPGEDAGVASISPPAVAVDASRVYELRAGVVEAFDAVDGTSVWSTDVAWTGESVSDLLRTGDQVVAVVDEAVIALDAQSGATTWERPHAVAAWRVELSVTDQAVVVVELGSFVAPEGG